MLVSTRSADRQPFRLTPDPEFVYISPTQLDAYSRLFSAIHMQQRCLLLTGNPGTGKTLFLRRLLLDLENAGIAVCAFWNPVSSPDRLWEACYERVERIEGLAQDVDVQSGLLATLKRNTTSIAVLLDEADALPSSVLESIARFVAACPSEKAPVSILLCGQPTLETRLRGLGMTASIATRIKLEPLRSQEVEHFVRHQLRDRLGGVEYRFSAEAVERLIALCGGLPARINVLCSGALLQAEIEGRTSVTPEMIDEHAVELSMASADYLTNDVLAPAAGTDVVRVEKTLCDIVGGLPMLVGNVHSVRDLHGSSAGRHIIDDMPPRGRGSTGITASLRAQAPPSASEGPLANHDAARNAALPGLSDDGSPEPSTEWLTRYEESADSNRTGSNDAVPPPMAPRSDADLDDRQHLERGRRSPGRLSEKGVVHGQRRPPHDREHNRLQSSGGEHRVALQVPLPSRRSRLLSTLLFWLALLLLLAIPADSVYISYDHITQAVTRFDAASADAASWFERALRSWMSPSATFASRPTGELSQPSTDYGRALVSQMGEGNSSAGLAVQAQPSTSIKSTFGIEMDDWLPREHVSVPALPAETALPPGLARRVENQGAVVPQFIADDSPATPSSEMPDPVLGHGNSGSDAVPIPERLASSAPKGSNSKPRLTLASQVEGWEDSVISLTVEPANLRASEYEVEISGLPRGALLSVGRLTDRVWTVPVAELPKLALTPKENSDDDISLTLHLVRTSDRRRVQTAHMMVSVNAVADQPKLAVNVADGDQYTPIPIEVRARLLDKDGSEELSVSVSGLPDSVRLSSGQRINGKWELLPADLAGLFMTPMAGSPTELNFAIEAIASESANGDRAVAQRELVLSVIPANR